MRSMVFRVGVAAAMAFVTLAAFAVPGEETTAQVNISNIPLELKNGVSAYKIFIQLSAGTNAKAGYVAKGEALIKGETAVVIDLRKPDGRPWSGMGLFNFAIVLSPKEVHTAEDISVHGGGRIFSSRLHGIAWAPGLINLHDIAPVQVAELFEGIIKPDADIIKH